jgi:cytoskeletal protein CcmA (bactofilin family)
MSAVTSANAASGSVTGTPRRTYVAINAFDDYFYSYSVSTEFTGGQFVTTGTLDTVSGANATTCPAGRILRENGKRLYPGVNPGVTNMLVGVFDDKTFFNGFIDPNAKVFQTQNNDIAPSRPDQVDDYTETRDLGNGVYTRGELRAEGNLDLSGNATIGGQLVVNEISYLRGDVNTYASTFVKAPIRIGDSSASYISRIKRNTVTVDSGEIGARNEAISYVQVPTYNAATDTILFNANPSTLIAGIAFGGAWLSTGVTSTACIKLINFTNGNLDPAPAPWSYTLFNFSS